MNEDKIWDMQSGELILTLTRNRFVVLDPEDNRLVFFQCCMYSVYDWMMTAYDIIVFDYENKITVKVDIPEGHVVGQPIITKGGKYLTFILQRCHRKMDSSLNEKSRDYEILLCMYSFYGQWRGLKTMDIRQLWIGVENTDGLLDLRNVTEDVILITYAKKTPFFAVTTGGAVDRDVPMEKGAFVYNVKNDSLLKRYETFLTETSSMDNLLVSHTTAIILDNKFQLFDVVTEKPPRVFDYLKELAAKGTVRLVMDGRYIVMISHNRLELLLLRSGSKDPIGRCYIHGRGTCLEVGPDDRTIFVGCATPMNVTTTNRIF